MIHRHLPNVLGYFTHPITNAVSEAINSTIQLLKKRAFGFRPFENFRVAVLFRCGALDLYPVSRPTRMSDERQLHWTMLFDVVTKAATLETLHSRKS